MKSSHVKDQSPIMNFQIRLLKPHLVHHSMTHEVSYAKVTVTPSSGGGCVGLCDIIMDHIHLHTKNNKQFNIKYKLSLRIKKNCIIYSLRVHENIYVVCALIDRQR